MFQVHPGHGATALDIQQQLDARRGWAVVSAPTLTPAGSFSVEVDGGEVLTVGQTHTPSSAVVDLDQPDADDPRRDVIYMSDTGSLFVERGTPNPVFPEGATRFDAWSPWPYSMWDIQGTVIAEVWVAPGATSLDQADIRERGIDADTTVHRTDAQRMQVAEAPSESTDVVRLADIGSDGSFGGQLDGSLDAAGYDIYNVNELDADYGYVSSVPNEQSAIVNRSILDRYYRLSGDRLSGTMDANDNDIQNVGTMDAEEIEAGDSLKIPVHTDDTSHDSDIWFRGDL